MDTQRSEVKSVYAEAERCSIRWERAPDSDSSFELANWSSSVINVSHHIFLSPADWKERQSCSGSPSWPVTCHHLWFAIRFSDSHPALPSSWGSIRNEIREGDYSVLSLCARNGNRSGAVITVVFSLSPAETLSVPMACDWSLAAPSVVSHSHKYAWSSAEETTIQETRIIWQ